VGQRFFHLVDQDQAQVARLQRASAVSMAMNSPWISLMSLVRRLQALAQQGEHLAIGAAALAGSWYSTTSSKASPRIRSGADVLVAAVAGAADDHRAALGRHASTA
jgi:hypothetical protein